MKQIFTLILLVCSALSLWASPAGEPVCGLAPEPAGEHKPPTKEQKEEFLKFKLDYFIQEMNLPADKQGEFKRIYTDYEKDREALFSGMWQKIKAFRADKEHSDADYLGMAEAMSQMKAKEGELEKSCFGKLRTILSPKQLYEFKKAENKFNRKVMEMQGKGKGKHHHKTKK